MKIVLVLGGLHGAWCWEHVVPLLREAGLTTSAPDVQGMGEDRTPFADVTLSSSANVLAGLVGGPRSVVLIGHSMAGLNCMESQGGVRSRDAFRSGEDR